MNNSIVPSNFVRFDADGLELVVDTSTCKAYASLSAAARMLEIPKSTAQGVYAKINTTDAKIHTNGGLQGVRLIDSETLYDMALDYNKSLARKMGSAGANVYMLKLAGYEIKPVEVPLIPQTYAQALLEAGRLAMQIEQDREATELGKAIAKSENNIRIGDFAKVIGMGQNKYFDELRDCKIIMATGTLPYQRFLNDGYFVVTETIVNNKAYPVALITPKEIGRAHV
jgi:phage antirepressor YoqD-like protein